MAPDRTEQLHQYLDYYQKALTREPTNVEARLQLARLFQQVGQTTLAVDEYRTASKLLAAQGMPLEAIAACKAVLALDPTHTQTQFFLARLYAQAPDASGRTARIARPIVAMPVDDEDDPLKALNEALDAEVEGERAANEDEEEVMVLTDVVRESEPAAAPDSEPKKALTDEPPPKGWKRDPELVSTIDVDADDIVGEEVFEVGVFDRSAVRLEEGSYSTLDELSFLPSLTGDEHSESGDESAFTSPVVHSVSRVDLPKIPLLSALTTQAFMELLRVADLRHVACGEVVRAQGERAAKIYIVVKGQCQVRRALPEGEVVDLAVIGEGDYFGEFELLSGQIGLAEIVAKTDVDVLEIDGDVISDLMDEYSEIRDELWLSYYTRLINNFLASSEVFSSLPAAEREALALEFVSEDVSNNDVVLEAGEPSTYLYLVGSGQLIAYVVKGDDEKLLEELGEGDFFGVSSVLNNAPCAYNVRASADSLLLCLPVDVFHRLIETHEAVKLQAALRAVRELPE